MTLVPSASFFSLVACVSWRGLGTRSTLQSTINEVYNKISHMQTMFIEPPVDKVSDFTVRQYFLEDLKQAKNSLAQSDSSLRHKMETVRAPATRRRDLLGPFCYTF